jgi:hypothetical protein
MAEMRPVLPDFAITRRVIDPNGARGQGGHTGSAKAAIRDLTSIDDRIDDLPGG